MASMKPVDEVQIPLTPEATDVWDRTQERGLFNIVPSAVQEAFIKASQRRPELFALGEDELYKELRNQNELPSATDNRMRLFFWLEYDRAQQDHRRMIMGNVFQGVCSRGIFYKMLTIPSKVAWLVCPPTDYMTKVTEALDFSLDRMRDILAMDPAPPGQKKDHKLMELQTKIWIMLDLRKNGAAVQRLEQKNMNLTLSVTDKQAAKEIGEHNMEALERRLKELERRDRQLQNLPEPAREEPLDVESTVVEDSSDA